MKRLLAMALCAAMILTVCLFAGCGNDTPSTDTTTEKSTPTQTTTESTPKEAEQTTAGTTPGETTASTNDGSTPSETTPGETTTNDEGGEELGDDLAGFDGYTKLPGYEDIDFGGRTFLIAGSDLNEIDMGSSFEIYSEDTDVISTAVRERNDLVERLYNCTIAYTFSTSPGTAAMNEVTGNQHTIDIYTAQYSSSGIYTADQSFNLYNLGIDFTNPWWDPAYVQTYTFDMNGLPAMYGALGDFSLTANLSTYILFYNKALYASSKVCQQYDIYQLVRDKKWTMDIFVEMIKDVRFDVNGNSTYSTSDNDIMGWIRTGHATHAMHVASNMKIVENVDGRFVFSPSADPAAWSNVIDKAAAVYATEGTADYSYATIPDYFAGNKALFVSEILNTIGNLKDADVAIGLVPYPLYSETQEGYCNYVDNHVNMYHIPISVPDPETVATFFELYTCHSKYTVREAFIEAYTVEYFGDDESGEMLDLILDNRTYDPGYLWWSAYETDIGNMISTNKNNITQWVGAKGARLNKNFEEFFTQLLDNKN